MSRAENIGRCQTCRKEYRYGDCFTAFCFDHDPAKESTRRMMAVKRLPGESDESFLFRLRNVGGAA